MEIPKYVEEALRLRTKYAVLLGEKSAIVDRFIFDNNLDEVIEDFDFCTGCEMYANPYDSARRIRDAILNK